MEKIMEKSFLFNFEERPNCIIANSNKKFPLRRIFCVGANYVAHAVEMGRNPDRDPPFFFSKPSDAIVNADSSISASIPYPAQTNDLHYEVELVVAIGKKGKDLDIDKSLDLVWGYSVGIDLTRRDLQQEAKAKRRPWDLSKGFDNSAIIGMIYPVSELGHPFNSNIWLSVNGKGKQNSNTSKLIWSVAEVISFLTQSVSLSPGDLIYTGTPEGVGPIAKGDKIKAGIDDINAIELNIN